MKFAISLLSELWLDSNDGPSTNRELRDGLRARGHQVEIVTSPVDPLPSDLDGLIPRWIWADLQLPPAVGASLALEARGVKALNSTAAMLRASDKRIADSLFAASGLSVPRPYDGSDGSWICKPAVGSMGGYIVTGSDPLTIDKLIRDAPMPYIVQERVEEKAIWRVVATPERQLGSYSWLPPSDSFSAVNGSYNFTSAPDHIVSFARQMVASVDGDLMGCDILEDKSGELYALEVNGSFGLIPFKGRLLDDLISLIEDHFA